MNRFFNILLALFCFLYLPKETICQVEITLEPFVNGLSRPVSIAHSGDERLFIVEKRGTIRIIDSEGNLMPGFFLDIRSKVDDSKSEKGLLGLDFHPEYMENGHFYVNYTNSSHTVVARYSVDPDDPESALHDSEFVLLTQDQPFDNHNGGDIHFGPEGYLYIGFGDGGNGGDPGNRAQNTLTWLGKMLRIDVNGGPVYQIPPDNPFKDDKAYLPEIWSYGLRNPWRFSFDGETGDMYIADVGQNIWEEIHVQPGESAGGENYGWRCYEGLAPFNFSQCAGITNFVDPVHVYQHSESNGCSITGGYVYRGQQQEFVGKYIYTDFCSGQFWMLYRNENMEWVNESLGSFQQFEYVAFGEDLEGELYVASMFDGRIYRIQFPLIESTSKVNELDLRIWPNPGGDQIEIELFEDSPFDIYFYNTLGQAVNSFTVQHNGQKALIDVADLQPGAYIITLNQRGKRGVENFVKKNK